MPIYELSKTDENKRIHFDYSDITEKSNAQKLQQSTDAIPNSSKAGQRKLRTETKNPQLLSMAPLQPKIENNNSELAKLLIEYGNNPEGCSAIAWAIHLGHDEVVKKLVSYGIKIDKNLLSTALKNKNFELADFFIENGQKEFDDSVLLNNLDVVQILEFIEQRGIMPDRFKTVDSLAYFIQNGMVISGIRFLLDHGTDCCSKITLPKYTQHSKNEKNWPGIWAILIDYYKMECSLVKLLVEHGAPINASLDTQSRWNLVLDVSQKASLSNDPGQRKEWTDLLAYLIQHGGKWPSDPKNSNPVLCLENLAESKNFELMFLINEISNCLDISGINVRGKHYHPHLKKDAYCILTPLQYAVLENNYDLAKKLLEHGANPNNPGADNIWKSVFIKRPISITIQDKNVDMTTLLLQYGAKID